MENMVMKKVTAFEKIYDDKKNTTTAFAMAGRYWLGYKITGHDSYLYKAYHIASTMYDENFANMELYFLCVFLDAELFEFDRVVNLIEDLKPYRNSMKNNDPQYYVYYLYFNCLIEINRNKSRAATKQYEALEGFCQTSNYADGDILLASLNVAFEEYSDAYNYIVKAYMGGNRSPFLYVCLRECYEKGEFSGTDGIELLMPFVTWGIAQGFDLEKTITIMQKQAMFEFSKHPGSAEEVYKIYPIDWILHIICDSLIKNLDFSESAFYYYKEAETRQLYFPLLNDFLVKSAYKNGIEDVSRYSLEQYLAKGDISLEIKPFIYHLLLKALNNGKFEALVGKYKYDIIQYGFYCLENRLIGRYYYGIYKFLIDISENSDGIDHEIDQEFISIAENIIKNVVFSYELAIENNKIKKIWIFEIYKKEAVCYEVKGATLKINVSDENFSYYCFGESMRNMIGEELSVTRLVENSDITLYKRFFAKRYYSPELLITLSKYYMSFEELPDECESVFEKTIAESCISNSFRMQVSAALGNFYALQSDYKKAVSYYNGVNENCLDDRNTEQMLIAYINAGEFRRAANLIIKKAECISDRNLFFALKQIAAKKEYDKLIADVAYELILKSWYDKTLIDIVLKHYKGSQEEWKELSRSLAGMSVIEQSLDEIILDNAIKIRSTDKGSQTVFVRMFEMNPDNQLVDDFCSYLTYEMIINSLKPEYQTLDALEKIFLAKEPHFLAYGLSHLYINNNVTTANTDFILHRAVEFCDEDDFIFPVFKYVKDKKFISPYIEKNQPFIYKSSPDNRVSFFYRIKGETEYKEKSMRYIRFGLHTTYVTQFFGEEIEYYISEQMSTGSIVSKEASVENNRIHLLENANDLYYIINNALIYEQMFKYEQVEEIITDRLKEMPRIKGWIM